MNLQKLPSFIFLYKFASRTSGAVWGATAAGVSAYFPFSEFADMDLFRHLFDVNFFGYGLSTLLAHV